MLDIGAAALGLMVPPLPLVRRGAWSLALAAALLWIGALYVFFTHYAGPGFLAHLGLWVLAVVGMCAPHRLAHLEARVRRAWRRAPN
jgi:hypothetical protein